jgi:peptidoglycan hydrolase-like protein with peptidoglycan-binding domain
LQERLKVEGYFPTHIDSTGYYGEITRQAVEKYQRANKVAEEWELNLVSGKVVGLKTLKALNK